MYNGIQISAFTAQPPACEGPDRYSIANGGLSFARSRERWYCIAQTRYFPFKPARQRRLFHWSTVGIPATDFTAPGKPLDLLDRQTFRSRLTFGKPSLRCFLTYIHAS